MSLLWGTLISPDMLMLGTAAGTDGEAARLGYDATTALAPRMVRFAEPGDSSAFSNTVVIRQSTRLP